METGQSTLNLPERMVNGRSESVYVPPPRDIHVENRQRQSASNLPSRLVQPRTTTTTMSALKSSTAGSSTPIRALPSQLALKAAPSVPPASQTFEPLIKATLRHRLLFRIFLYSALFSWTVVWGQSIWSRGGITTVGPLNALMLPFWPSTVAFTLATWALGIAPVVIARKAYLSGTSPSPCLTFSC